MTDDKMSDDEFKINEEKQKGSIRIPTNIGVFGLSIPTEPNNSLKEEIIHKGKLIIARSSEKEPTLQTIFSVCNDSDRNLPIEQRVRFCGLSGFKCEDRGEERFDCTKCTMPIVYPHTEAVLDYIMFILRRDEQRIERD